MDETGSDNKISSLLNLFNGVKSSDEMIAKMAKKPFVFDDAYISSAIERVKKVFVGTVTMMRYKN